METLSSWITEMEDVIKTNTGYRVYTDYNHGFYFDINIKSGRCTTMDGLKLKDDINIQLLICDLQFLDNLN
jgi:hypothetical protein